MAAEWMSRVVLAGVSAAAMLVAAGSSCAGEQQNTKRATGPSKFAVAMDALSRQKQKMAGKKKTSSGLPTGKRQHKPMTFTQPIDK